MAWTAVGFAHLQVSIPCLGNNGYRDLSLIPGFNWISGKATNASYGILPSLIDVVNHKFPFDPFSEYQIKYEDERLYVPKKGSGKNSLEVLSI